MPRLHVEEVVEEAHVARDSRRLRSLGCIPKKAKGREHAVARLSAGDPAALDPHWIRGEAEPDRGDARERWPRRAVGDEPVLWIRELPEESERACLHGVEERIVASDGRRYDRGGRGCARERECN